MAALMLKHKEEQQKTATHSIFNQSASPNVTIPDNDAIGISDTLHCTKSLLLRTISISVNITHSYIGDLTLTLTSPSATMITLHARTGGGTDHLQHTYTTENTPALHQLANEPCFGDWQLQIQDMAAEDVGRFKQWSLNLTGSIDRTIHVEDNAGIRIPDSDPLGIERTLVIIKTGKIATITVTLDISHSYIGDLQVSLTSPKGKTILLHNRSGKNEENIIARYTLTNTPELSVLAGQSVTGNWLLNIVDQAAHDVGKLNYWELTIVPEEPA